MTSREQVLQVLESRAGETVSGEELAAALGISRAAVWKAIGRLRVEGHHIEAGTNRGYCLIPDSDILSPQGIAACLGEPEAARNIRVYPELDSTNLQAKRLALEGAPDGTAILGRTADRWPRPARTRLFFPAGQRPVSQCIAASGTSGRRQRGADHHRRIRSGMPCGGAGHGTAFTDQMGQRPVS